MLGFCHFSSSEHTGYRFGFNGMEKDDEVKGNGNSLDFGARIYDPRIGRWLSTDPSERRYPGISPYNYVFNNPLIFDDPTGMDGRLTVTKNENGGGTITLETTIHVYGVNATDDVVQGLNNQWNSYNNEYTYIDDAGDSWLVKIDMKYVLAESLNSAEEAIGMKNVDELSAQTKQAIGFQDGDNVMKLAPDQGQGDQGHMGETWDSYSIYTGTGAKGATHEGFHLFGFQDRSYGDLKTDGMEGDIMWWSGQKSISDIHFIDIAEKYLGEKDGYTPFSNFDGGTRTGVVGGATNWEQSQKDLPASDRPAYIKSKVDEQKSRKGQ